MLENFNKYNLESDLIIQDIEKTIYPTDEKLQQLLTQLDNVFKKENQNFAELCFCVYKIRDLFDQYKWSGKYWYNSKNVLYTFDTIMSGYGISQAESSKLIACYNKYCSISESDIYKAKCCIIEEFKGFSKSKLFELLPVPSYQIVEDLKSSVLKYSMTAQSIRQYVKNYQSLQKQQERLNEPTTQEEPETINEDEIPEAYDPKKEYEFAYFESKTKNQLLNIVWDLQKEYQRLKKEKTK